MPPPPTAVQPAGRSFFDRLLRRQPKPTEQVVEVMAAQEQAHAAQIEQKEEIIEQKEDILEQQMQQVQATEQEILLMVQYIYTEVQAAMNNTAP
jgi:hypothetical protein